MYATRKGVTERLRNSQYQWKHWNNTIAGTALGLLGNGALGGLFGNPMMNQCHENTFVNRFELGQEQKISQLESKNALLESTIYTDGKLNDLRNYVDNRFNQVTGELSQIAVYQATNTSTLNCLANQVAQLQGLTKVIVPIANVCPQPMPQYNSWTAPTAPTTTTG